MKINFPIGGKPLIALAGAAVFLLTLFLISLLFKSESKVVAERLAHLDYMVNVLESYKNRNGHYPQPTARDETIEGFRHVWGYRPDKPALASCLLVMNGKKPGTLLPSNEEEHVPAPDGLESVCGGNIYNADGKVIGWKGTLTIDSALNNVEAVLKDDRRRLTSPLSEWVKELPIDPSYTANPELQNLGFGEYVYAVRAPEDGSLGKGGTQYQIATTVPDETTGELRTIIRGNYFVRSDQREEIPPSLIGPGIIFDSQGVPVGEKTRLFHVLLDGQLQGFANPLLGEGEKTIRVLTLQRKAETLLKALSLRLDIFGEFIQTEELSTAINSLQNGRKKMESVVEQLSTVPVEDEEEAAAALNTSLSDEQLASIEAEIEETMSAGQDAIREFLHAKDQEVLEVLDMQIGQRDKAVLILSGALLRARDAHQFVLQSRDELVRYLDGEGIEEQARSRSGKHLESALTAVPDLLSLFVAENLRLPQPFLSEETQARVDEISKRESIATSVRRSSRNIPTEGESLPLSSTFDPSTLSIPRLQAQLDSEENEEEMEEAHSGSGGELLEKDVETATGEVLIEEEEQVILPDSAVMISTVASEIITLFSDMEFILHKLQDDLRSPAVSVKDIDADLRRLSRALSVEQDRIQNMFFELADETVVAEFRKLYEKMGQTQEEDESESETEEIPEETEEKEEPDLIDDAKEKVLAIHTAANFSRQHGDFSALLFRDDFIESVVLQREPGIPDISAYARPEEAEYQGIPYPLP